jgi:hypothetical protein
MNCIILNIVIRPCNSGLRLSIFHERVICRCHNGTWQRVIDCTREVWPTLEQEEDHETRPSPTDRC